MVNNRTDRVSHDQARLRILAVGVCVFILAIPVVHGQEEAMEDFLSRSLEDLMQIPMDYRNGSWLTWSNMT